MWKKIVMVVAMVPWTLALSLLACEWDGPRTEEFSSREVAFDAGAPEEQATRDVDEEQALARVDQLLRPTPIDIPTERQEENTADGVVEEGDLSLSLAYKHVDLEPCDHMVEARRLLKEGDRAQAMLELEKELYDHPQNGQAAMLLGLTARKSGDDDLATDAFMRVAEISPDGDAPWVQLARVSLEQGQLDDAEQLLRRALKLKADRAQTYNLLGRVWLGRSHWQRAILNFKKALKLKPDSAYYRNNLGFACLLMKDFGRAVEVLEPLAQKTDVPVFMLNNLGLAYEGVGRVQDALAQFKNASERDPSYLKSRINLERLVQVAKASAEVTEEASSSEPVEPETDDMILPEAE